MERKKNPQYEEDITIRRKRIEEGIKFLTDEERAALTQFCGPNFRDQLIASYFARRDDDTGNIPGAPGQATPTEG